MTTGTQHREADYPLIRQVICLVCPTCSLNHASSVVSPAETFIAVPPAYSASYCFFEMKPNSHCFLRLVFKAMLTDFCAPCRGLVYQICFQLTLAELRYGRVVNRFVARGSRRFPTAELTIILADLYEEVGPSATLLGLEIVQIMRLPALPR